MSNIVNSQFHSDIDPHSLAKALGGEVRGDQILAPGPGHSASDRSLSVKVDPRAPDGLVVYSFAGDDPITCKDYVREKAGLGAFKPNGQRRKGSTNGSNSGPQGSVEAHYDYCDESSTLLYQVIRLKPKGFRQRRPDGKDGWIWNLDGVRRVLYRLPELLQFPDGTVFVCEGEKDADRVASLGHCATTVASGTHGRAFASSRSRAATSSSFRTMMTPGRRRRWQPPKLCTASQKPFELCFCPIYRPAAMSRIG
jgi:hypothetical protein